MEPNVSMHKRSKSDFCTSTEEYQFNNILAKSLNHPQLKLEQKKRQQLTSTMTLDSLKHEILQLQQQLRNQFVTRGALEEEIHYNSILHDSTHDSLISKPTKDLIKDVAVLELEVLYLERYLLSMYRKALTRRIESSYMMNRSPKLPSANQGQKRAEFQTPKESNPQEILLTHGSESMKTGDVLGNSHMECGDILGAGLLADSTVQRSHSSLSRHSAIPLRTSPTGAVAEAIDSYHSLPLSMLEHAQVSTSGCVGTSNQDHYWETPNRISEEMIKGISAILCQLADPPLLGHGFPSSPVSFSSSKSSPQAQHDNWSLHCKQKSPLDDSFHIETFEEYPQPFSTATEVQGICRDAQNLRKIESMLRSYRGLVSALELVDPQKMKHEEKLAFWINVHNALVMHALLVYGVHQNNVKRISMLLKAAYNIGGNTVSVDMIQCSILACRLPRPGQWLQSLFSSRVKDKNKGFLKSYAILHPEPRLHFALCSGSQSDPVVRLYTPKRVFQDLELAKEEYIQTTINIQKEMKLQMPKKVDTFVKESSLSSAGVVELIEHCLPSSLRRFQQPQQAKFWKKILWVPHNFSFRYLIADELLGFKDMESETRKRLEEELQRPHELQEVKEEMATFCDSTDISYLLQVAFQICLCSLLMQGRVKP